jgi:release factor glutamine methyltransferase
MKVREALRLAAEKFHNANITSANLDARLLLAKVLEVSSEYLISGFDQDLTNKQQSDFVKLTERRLSFEPIAYILGYKEFYSRQFAVDKRVLIPRGDTEILVDAVIDYSESSQHQAVKILDLGTGSGAIAVTLALEIINSKIVATDISEKALELAVMNAGDHNVLEQINFLQSDWYQNLPHDTFDIIVSNPPYIANEERHLMAEETKKFEPQNALFAEDQGLAHYKAIIKGAKEFLSPKGRIFLELGFRQAEEVQNILKQNHFVVIKIVKDLRGFSRVIEAALL